MIRLLLVFTMPLLVLSCIGQHSSNAQKAAISEEKPGLIAEPSDTVSVDLSRSNVHWKGTKMRGAGKHEGELRLRSAYLLNDENGHLSGGRFIADMTTIGVTDIPEHEPIPMRNLNNHLKSEDFFDAANHPTSKFAITKVEHRPNDSLLISGNLTIKGITRNIEFSAIRQEKTLSAKFTFDRFQWNIAYEGNWADKTLVDKDVELSVGLQLK